MNLHESPGRTGSTIYDVAALAGVSITTISRYLNAPEQVGAGTAERILEAMNSLAYIPHGNAGAKAARKVGRIGVLTPFVTAPSFVLRLDGITRHLRDLDFETIIYAVETPGQLRDYLRSIPGTKRLDGLIVMAMAIDDADTARLRRASLQVVMLEHEHPAFTSIVADGLEGGALAARTFLAKGYLPCGFIGEATVLPYAFQPGAPRLEGYRRELERAGAGLAPEHVRLGENTVADARRMALELLELPAPPRSVFTMSDLQAIGVLKAARERRLRVPEDLAVMGFDDIEEADHLDLSTISQGLAESGRLAAQCLVDRLRHPDRPRQLIRVPVTPVQRRTT